MRTPLIAGNWKMNLLRSDAIALARGVAAEAPRDGVETLVCPPALFLYDVRAALEGSPVMLGSQDVYWEEKGAFTGELSVTQVAEAAAYAIIGHSERRQYFCETDETVRRKVSAAIGTGRAADGSTAQEAVAFIRETLHSIRGPVADSVRILYGGSVAPDNASEHLGQPDVDGALVGGASLKVDTFMAIVRAAATSSPAG
jgi:triosephosphate isomerase